MKILGITGGIGCGKSVVVKVLKTMGIPVYDSDDASEKLINLSQNIKKKLSEKFGSVIYNGNVLNKLIFSSLIFSHSCYLSFVNSVIHPEVLRDFFGWKMKQEGKLFVGIETAILFESGFDKLVDIIINVFTPINIRVRRLQVERKLDKSAIFSRINSQLTDKERLFRSNYTLVNDDKYPILPQIENLFSILGA
jgi:dephospho-CoA kinase